MRLILSVVECHAVTTVTLFLHTISHTAELCMLCITIEVMYYLSMSTELVVD